MNRMQMNVVSNGVQSILSNIPESNNTRNALYDLTLLHLSAKEAQTTLVALMSDPSSLKLYMPYSAASLSFISIPRWIYEFASNQEVSSKNKVRLQRVEKIAKLIRSMENPITEHHKKDVALAEKMLGLWKHIEDELQAIWVDTIMGWDISTQMSCFRKESCTEYVKHLIEYKTTKTDSQLLIVNHFAEMYFSNLNNSKAIA